MKKVLVTGADGFIGSHLVAYLVGQGYSVRAFCFYNSMSSLGWLDTLSEDVKSKIDFYLGDIRDAQLVNEAMNGIDIVYHLAALITIPYSYKATSSYIDTNIKGTLNVLEAAKINKVKRVLITSTSEVYGTAQYIPIDEKHPKNAQSPYAASKIGADALALSFYQSYGLPVTIVRPFNTFGPRQSIRAIIPTIITQLNNGNDVISLGNLKPTRDFLFIEDTVSAFDKISKAEKLIGQEVNIATNSEIGMRDLAKLIIEKINPKVTIKISEERLRSEKSEVYRLYGDNTKLLTNTNWMLTHTFEEGLQKTIDWYSKPSNLQMFSNSDYQL